MAVGTDCKCREAAAFRLFLVHSFTDRHLEVDEWMKSQGHGERGVKVETKLGHQELHVRQSSWDPEGTGGHQGGGSGSSTEPSFRKFPLQLVGHLGLVFTGDID